MADTSSRLFSRRRFLGAIAVAPAVTSAELHVGASGRSTPKLVVVGAGAFGGWIALQLRRSGAEVTLIDSWGAGNSRSSSGGESRALRAIYGGDRIYTRMVARSRELWRGLERDCKASIYSEIGALWMITGDDSYVRQGATILDELGFEVEPLGHDEAGKRYPQIAFDGVESIYFERYAGLLAARESCRCVAEQLEREGGATQRGAIAPLPGVEGPLRRIGLTDGSTIEGDHFVLACGPWLGSLLPDLLGEAITPTRQEVYYFGPPAGSRVWQPDRLPVWVELGERVVYGFPDTTGRGFKFADDTRGEPIDPSSVQRRPTARLVDEARGYLARRFPALAEAPLVEARVCQYENSPDGHLILDRHPRVENLWVAGGGSGHGFKLAPAVGEMMARAILGGEPAEPRFSVARLEGDSPSRTQFESHGESS